MPYQIEECPDLYVDACACDEQGNLVFLSAWGRDTALQEFLARLTLGSADNGLTQFHILAGNSRISVFPNLDFLDKRTTRQLRGTLFGSLLHLWLFDQRCALPDRANHTAFALLSPDQISEQRLWALAMDICPLPLLDHWRDQVLAVLNHTGMLHQLPHTLGPVKVWRIALQLEPLEAALGELIRQQKLTIGATNDTATPC
ncbi:hypothetical protein ACIQAL_22145 [Pseudomonas sp. NPDC088368]|uniref:hypothetical protein n=1 Tax=Pseudomonas sp. NPDC088368 TaxID=3364453 RepID=UPI00382A0B03